MCRKEWVNCHSDVIQLKLCGSLFCIITKIKLNEKKKKRLKKKDTGHKMTEG